MLRIGYVLKTFPRLSQTFVVNELRAHERAGVRVTIFSLKPPKSEDVGIVQPPLDSEVVILEGPSDHWPDQLVQKVSERGITHLHAHFGNIASHVARLAARQLEITYSFTAHALDIFDQKVKQDELEKKIHDAAAVITVSHFNVRHLMSTFSRRPVLVYNGMPLDRFSYHQGNRTSGLILAVGRLVEKKGFTDLIEACHLLACSTTSFHCEIIGTGPLHDELQMQIEQRGLSDRVRLLGACSPEVVQDQIRKATLVVAPCVVAKSGDRDGLPTILLEAMALGTPCISTDVTGIPEVIIDGETGLQVPQHHPRYLADACRRLLEDPALANRLTNNARKLIEERFDSDRTSARLRAVWDSPPRRILFRIHNRRGLGHWMRSLNLARELIHLQPWSDLLFYTRSEPPFSVENVPLRTLMSDDQERMDLLAKPIVDFDPHLIVDDTMLPEGSAMAGAKRVLVMRRCTEDKQNALFQSDALRAMDLLLVPHTVEEFGYDLPEWLKTKTVFVGPIVRYPNQQAADELGIKYGLQSSSFTLVSTPGGGGFTEDAVKFFDVVSRVHQNIENAQFRHIVVRGPNAKVSLTPVDERMIVVDSEAEMVSLLSIADAVISAGGYNTVSEIHLTQRPAFFLPGKRKYDDQEERVRELERRGLAWLVEDDDLDNMAAFIVEKLEDRLALKAIHRCYANDEFVPGNRAAAEALLKCAHS